MSMRITRIEWKRLKNLGNFEHESLSLTVELEPYDNPHEAVVRAKKFVEAELNIDHAGDIPF